jgi:hypothetical protein
MKSPDWVNEFSAAIDICDKDGVLLYLNQKAVKSFESEGGEKLIGTSILNCHSEQSNEIIREMMKKEAINCYITEKMGRRKLVYQSPWYKEGEYMGIVEIVLELPADIRVRVDD